MPKFNGFHAGERNLLQRMPDAIRYDGYTLEKTGVPTRWRGGAALIYRCGDIRAIVSTSGMMKLPHLAMPILLNERDFSL